MVKDLKPHRSISEQLDLLKSRGLIIGNDIDAVKVLSNVNYYRLTGYLHEFKSASDHKYIDGITFEKIVDMYIFDSKLTRILMYALENVEETYKTRFSYTLSSAFPDNPEIYLDRNIYRDENNYLKFVTLFNREKSNNSGLPFIKHHNSIYGGKLPIWVAVEILTMGNMHSLYDNLKSTYQKQIARLYNTGPVQMKSWLENITYTRNHLAHYMRIYSYHFGRTPASCKNHPNIISTGRIFDQIMVIGFMFSDADEWKSYVVPEIKNVITSYSDTICLEKIGFPENWEEVLNSIGIN